MPPRKRAASTPAAKPKSPKNVKKGSEPAVASSAAAVSTGVPRTAADAWSNSEYVSDGSMGQEGFSKLCVALGIEEMSFEACYLNHLLCPSIDNVLIVCNSKAELQRGIEAIGCRTLSDLPAKLRARRLHIEKAYGTVEFTTFWKWLFEMGMGIQAFKVNAPSSSVRTVPLDAGVQLMDACISAWWLFPKLRTFSTEVHGQAFTKDLWIQIGRFINLTTVGVVLPDLSNYDDDAAGGGNAWPCFIDEFVEWFQAGKGGGE